MTSTSQKKTLSVSNPSNSAFNSSSTVYKSKDKAVKKQASSFVGTSQSELQSNSGISVNPVQCSPSCNNSSIIQSFISTTGIGSDIKSPHSIISRSGYAGSHSGNVKVICRFRPVSEKEKEQTKGMCADFIDYCQVAIKTTHDLNTYRFSFDRIFAPTANQQDVFDLAARPIIDSVLEGFNGTIFAYGQTSSGKTFTMMGDLGSEINEGIIPRMVQHVFNHISNSPEYEYIVKVSMMEIYMERVRDLIETNRVNLNIREDKIKGNFVDELSEHYVSSEEEVMEFVRVGSSNRTTAYTNMNDSSSRSHTILQLTIKSSNINDLTTRTGKLFLVDLAGSEKIAKTGATGLTLDEAKNINKSLTTLGMVINSLTDEKSTHVPYRESKVTRILQESLGGNAKTCLIITCSPSSHNDLETLSTLRFGMRAKKIENKPKINKEVSVAELKIEIERLENIISETNSKLSIYEKLLVQNNISLPKLQTDMSKGKSPKKIGKSYQQDNNNIKLNASQDESDNIKDDVLDHNSLMIDNHREESFNNHRKSSENYLQTGFFEDRKAEIYSKDQNKASIMISENRSLIKQLLEFEETIKRLMIESDENRKELSQLYELKYKFEDIEAENIGKIEYLERKIKKLRFDKAEEQTEIYCLSIEPIKNKIEEIVSLISENHPSFEYNKREFIRDCEQLIENYKVRITIKSSKSCNLEEAFDTKGVISSNESEQDKIIEYQNQCSKILKEAQLECQQLNNKLKDITDNYYLISKQVLDLKSKVDFHESGLSQDQKNYIKRIESLEASLNQVNKLYHQILAQKSALKIENDILQKLVCQKNDTITKLDKEIDLIKDNEVSLLYKYSRFNKTFLRVMLSPIKNR